MKYAVSANEMKIYDRNTSEHFGVSSEVLMERAALFVCDRIDLWRSKRNPGRRYRVLILAGTGNNGGDGICAARILKQRGYEVTLCTAGDPTKYTDLCLKQLKIAENYGITPKPAGSFFSQAADRDYDVYVDALLGVGLSRPLSGDYLKAAAYINECKNKMGSDVRVISVDIPTGLSSDTGQVLGEAVLADETVTFNFKKIGHILYPGCEYSGEVTVCDVGITEESFLQKPPAAVYYDGEVKDLLPVRKRDANKGTNGKVLVVAGSKDISGACILSASAALKAGAGMVRVFTAIENAEAVRALLPEAILDVYEDYEPVRDKLQKAMEWSTQAVVGPGIGCEGKGAELMYVMLSDYDKSMILDADALNLIAGDEKLYRLASNYATNGKKLILTPHMGEFARLYKAGVKACKEHLLEYPVELSKKMHATILCKDARSIVADSNEKKIYINVSGNDGMATAGSGDVLSGIVGAFLSMGMDGFDTAAAAAYVHGRAGDAAAAKCGRYSLVATDIVAALSEVLD